MDTTTKSLDALYSDLCIEFRRLHFEKSQGAWKCENCERLESDHRDGRCSCHVTTASFRSAFVGRLAVVTEALGLIEQLKATLAK